MQPHELDARQGQSHFNHLWQHLDADAKLVVGCGSGDVAVRVRIDIGIHPDGHSRHLAGLLCQFVDHLQFGYRLHIEAGNVVYQAQIDFSVGFTHPGKHHPGWRETSLESYLNLLTTHQVGPKAF